MGLGNTTTAWGWPARLLHWGMAVMILGMLGFGFWLALAYNPGDIAKLDQVQLHKSFGFVVFVLACLRIVWRAVNPGPAPPPGTSAPMRLAARAGHLVLYALMLAMPLTGWLAASSSPYNDPGYMNIPNEVFGLFAMPDPFPEGSHELTDAFQTAHLWLALALLAVLAVHVGAALTHQLVDRDDVMRRMWRG